MRRIYTGFILAALAIIYAAALQHHIYTLSPCQRYASGCSSGSAPISVWLQLPAYLLLALSQLMVAITGMEYGYSQSHKGLKSIVMCLLTLTIAGGGILNMTIA
jgi:POT family proton-dependent oligopeptide transporter